MNKFLSIVIASALFVGCSQKDVDAPEAEDVALDANAIAESSIIIDTHIDVPYRLKSKPDDISVATQSGDFDYPRSVSGFIYSAFM
jgi:membrane dipeptidase